MTRTLLLATMWAAVCLTSEGQTNCPTLLRPAFSMSTTVRQIPVEPVRSLSPRTAAQNLETTEGSPQLASRRFADAMTLSTPNSDSSERLYRRLEQSGKLNLLMPTAPSGPVGIVDAIFEPEVIRLGRTSVSGSFITAYKRKNPLCLLNPIFFNFSW